MIELEFIGKLALSGLVIFIIGLIMTTVYAILSIEELIDYDTKWPQYVANYSMGIGIVIMILSLFFYIWV